MMDETTYYRHTKAAFAKVEDALDSLAEGVVDFERSGDVLTVIFPSGKKCVLNTQRPTRQLWLAADARAWHFSWDSETSSWRDDKGLGIELFGKISEIVKGHVGAPLVF